MNWDYYDDRMLKSFWASTPERQELRARLPDMADRVLVFHRGITVAQVGGGGEGGGAGEGEEGEGVGEEEGGAGGARGRGRGGGGGGVVGEGGGEGEEEGQGESIFTLG